MRIAAFFMRYFIGRQHPTCFFARFKSAYTHRCAMDILFPRDGNGEKADRITYLPDPFKNVQLS